MSESAQQQSATAAVVADSSPSDVLLRQQSADCWCPLINERSPSGFQGFIQWPQSEGITFFKIPVCVSYFKMSYICQTKSVFKTLLINNPDLVKLKLL